MAARGTYFTLIMVTASGNEVEYDGDEKIKTHKAAARYADYLMSAMHVYVDYWIVEHTPCS